MRKVVTAVAMFLLAAALPAVASLTIGATAPEFKTQASLGGKVFEFDLASALKKGPVVLYFYPAAFTHGCTIEAHDFADAMDQYKALGATVIGVSHDTIETLNQFSVSECRSKFPVASDPDLAIAKSYDAILAAAPQYANRTSYVIAKNGSIYYTYTDLNPDQHVANTLAALKQLENSTK
ncbi:MAG: peroxiredoxin [Candidatus Eremiobacteraeota bacterium]|nr:peroxiredoxin [Candidatus Eremiobacteraeota bacterium]